MVGRVEKPLDPAEGALLRGENVEPADRLSLEGDEGRGSRPVGVCHLPHETFGGVGNHLSCPVHQHDALPAELGHLFHQGLCAVPAPGARIVASEEHLEPLLAKQYILLLVAPELGGRTSSGEERHHPHRNQHHEDQAQEHSEAQTMQHLTPR